VDLQFSQTIQPAPPFPRRKKVRPSQLQSSNPKFPDLSPAKSTVQISPFLGKSETCIENKRFLRFFAKSLPFPKKEGDLDNWFSQSKFIPHFSPSKINLVVSILPFLLVTLSPKLGSLMFISQSLEHSTVYHSHIKLMKKLPLPTTDFKG